MSIDKIFKTYTFILRLQLIPLALIKPTMTMKTITTRLISVATVFISDDSLIPMIKMTV